GRRHRCHHHGDRDRRGARCPPFRTSGHRAGAERLCEATSVNRCHLSVCSVLWVTLSTRPVRYRWAARIVGTVRALWCVPVWPEGDAMMKLAATAIVTLVFAGPALAADIPYKAPPPPLPKCANFKGFYIGGHGGWTYYKNDWKDQDNYGFNFTFQDHIGD